MALPFQIQVLRPLAFMTAQAQNRTLHGGQRKTQGPTSLTESFARMSKVARFKDSRVCQKMGSARLSKSNLLNLFVSVMYMYHPLRLKI